MGFESWHAFYRSDLQAVYALWTFPLLFLVWMGATGRWRAKAGESRDDRFLRLYALGFAVETLIDPVATGPLVGALGWGATGATLSGLLFVLLGDFRVYWLVFALADRRPATGAPLRRALLFTPIVAIGGFAINAALGTVFGEMPGQVLWLCHELLFVAVALWLRHTAIAAVEVPRRDALRRVCAFVITYYGLWAASDALILATGNDVGWLLRVLPNQLYYGLWVPTAYFALRDEL